MHRFRVWAPPAENVEVILGDNDTRFAMSRDSQDNEWWQTDVETAQTGSDYAYSINGGVSLPDPRSAWQPYGVHGMSRLVDHSLFSWTDKLWQSPPLQAAVIYELHIGTFTPEGTFDATIACLPHLTELGITHVELMPVNHFSGDWGWGYDGVDLYAPHHAYGGPDGLKRLVDACHAQGLGIVLDVVYNHLGPSGNYLSQFGPYMTERYETPWGAAVNLDGRQSGEVRRFFIDNAKMWLRDYHFDGLRIDAVHALIDNGATHLLEQMVSEVEGLGRQLGRHLFLIAESDLNDPKIVRSREIGGYGVHAQWSDDFHHAIHSVLTGERAGYYEDFGGVDRLAKAIEDVFVFDGVYSPHRDRTHGRPATGIPRYRFLGYSQNHDQVGNRARGERLCHLVQPGQARIAAGLVLLSPFVPMLFQGEEWAASTPFQYFTHHEDPELAAAVSRGRRSEFVAFGWQPDEVPDPQDTNTFLRSKLNWDERHQGEYARMLDWYKQLIDFRRTHRAIADADTHPFYFKADQESGNLILRRGPYIVTVNLSRDPQTIFLNELNARDVLLQSEKDIEVQPGGVRMPPWSLAVLAHA